MMFVHGLYTHLKKTPIFSGLLVSHVLKHLMDHGVALAGPAYS
jgi:hypothetical protein